MAMELVLLIMAAMVGLTIWLFKRWMYGVEQRRRDDTQMVIDTHQRLTNTIDKIDDTLINLNLSFATFKEHTLGRIEEIGQTAIRAERVGKYNEGSLVEHNTRITKLETEHNLFHKQNKKESKQWQPQGL